MVALIHSTCMCVCAFVCMGVAGCECDCAGVCGCECVGEIRSVWVW